VRPSKQTLTRPERRLIAHTWSRSASRRLPIEPSNPSGVFAGAGGNFSAVSAKRSRHQDPKSEARGAGPSVSSTLLSRQARRAPDFPLTIPLRRSGHASAPRAATPRVFMTARQDGAADAARQARASCIDGMCKNPRGNLRDLACACASAHLTRRAAPFRARSTAKASRSVKPRGRQGGFGAIPSLPGLARHGVANRRRGVVLAIRGREPVLLRLGGRKHVRFTASGTVLLANRGSASALSRWRVVLAV